MYVRVRKQHARKLYELNAPITMVAHKMLPFGGWSLGYTVNKDNIDSREEDWTFDKLVDNYTSYNACYEMGYYPAFYVPGDVVTKFNVPTMEIQ
jgi:hypothetical protein